MPEEPEATAGRRTVPAPIRCVLAAALLVGARPAEEQAPPEIPAEAELVRLDVVVTDGRRPVTGLSRDDFAVLEDGRPQEITQFEVFVRPRGGEGELVRDPTTGPAPARADEAATAPPARHVVLAIDDLHISLGNLSRIKEALLGFVESELGPGDDAAVVVTSGTLGVTQAFTGDVGLLREAISRVSPKPLQAWPGVPYISRYQAELIVRGDIEALDLAVEEIRLEGSRVPRPEEMAEQKARGIFKESSEYARAALRTLDSVVRSLIELPGRKVVVLVSDGFLLGLGASGGQVEHLQRLVDGATRAGVVVYTLDTRGLLATAESGRSEFNGRRVTTRPGIRERFERAAEQAERDGLHAVAEETGGFLVESVNDLGAGLQRIARDTETYYLLAYAPTDTRHDGRFRKIEVRLPGHTDLEVRTRAGYYARDEREEKKQAKQAGAPGERAARELLGALASLYPRSEVPLRLAADYVSQGSAGQLMLLSAHVDLSAARFRRDGENHVARLVLVGTVYDADGAPTVSLDPQSVDLRLDGAQLERAQREGLKYEKALPLPPGLYEVRLAVRDDASGDLGSASVRVALPDLSDGALRIAGPILMRAVEPESPGAGAALRQVQANPRYARGDLLYYQLQVLNAKTDASGTTRVVIQAHVLEGADLRGSTAEARLETRPQVGLPPDFAGRVSLGALEPGDYRLRVVVTDDIAGTRVERLLAFTVTR